MDIRFQQTIGVRKAETILVPPCRAAAIPAGAIRRLLILALLVCLAACREDAGYPPLVSVSAVDLHRYLGRWYEIARIDHSFQKDCVASTADYSLRPDGDIRVVNACRKKDLDGEVASIEGKAWVHDRKSAAWLKVQFFWPFRGDYVIIDLDEAAYGYAVVGHPSRDYLWILSRTPAMEEKTYADILRRIAGQGYALDRIRKYPQIDARRKP